MASALKSLAGVVRKNVITYRAPRDWLQYVTHYVLPGLLTERHEADSAPLVKTRSMPPFATSLNAPMVVVSEQDSVSRRTDSSVAYHRSVVYSQRAPRRAVEDVDGGGARAAVEVSSVD